jgi:hypothetical protein
MHFKLYHIIFRNLRIEEKSLMYFELKMYKKV